MQWGFLQEPFLPCALLAVEFALANMKTFGFTFWSWIQMGPPDPKIRACIGQSGQFLVEFKGWPSKRETGWEEVRLFQFWVETYFYTTRLSSVSFTIPVFKLRAANLGLFSAVQLLQGSENTLKHSAFSLELQNNAEFPNFWISFVNWALYQSGQVCLNAFFLASRSRPILNRFLWAECFLPLILFSLNQWTACSQSSKDVWLEKS